MKTVFVEGPAWFGLGRLRTGLFPGVCLGFVRVSWARGSLKWALLTAFQKT